MAVAPTPNDDSQQLAALLYERHAAALRRFCLQRLRHREDAEEAVQATYLRALRSLQSGVRPHAERAWLLTIARNVCVSTASAPRRRAEVETDPLTLAEAAGAVSEPDPPELDLDGALAALPDGQRRALLLREVDGLTYREIAGELAVSVSAVETWIFRARRSLAASVGTARRLVLDIPTLASLVRAVVSTAPAAKVAAAAAVVSTGVIANEVIREPAVEPRRAVVAVAPKRATLPSRAATAPAAAKPVRRAPAAPAPERKRRAVLAPPEVAAPARPGRAPVAAPRAESPEPAKAAPTGAPPVASEPAVAQEPAPAPAAEPSLAPVPAPPRVETPLPVPAVEPPPVTLPPVALPTVPELPLPEPTKVLPPLPVDVPPLPLP